MFSIFKNQELSISHLKDEELTNIAVIHKDSFEKAWDEGELASTLNSKGVSCLTAHDLSKPKHGTLGFLVYRTTGDEAEVITIASAPSKRRKGVGKTLMDEMIRNCLTERVSHIFLEVDEANAAAVSLYQKLGFIKVGERKGYYKSGKTKKDGTPLEKTTSTALIMKLDLTA